MDCLESEKDEEMDVEECKCNKRRDMDEAEDIWHGCNTLPDCLDPHPTGQLRR